MRTLPTTMIRLLTPFAPLFSKRVKETDRMSETVAKITIGALIGGAVGLLIGLAAARIGHGLREGRPFQR